MLRHGRPNVEKVQSSLNLFDQIGSIRGGGICFQSSVQGPVPARRRGRPNTPATASFRNTSMALRNTAPVSRSATETARPSMVFKYPRNATAASRTPSSRSGFCPAPLSAKARDADLKPMLVEQNAAPNIGAKRCARFVALSDSGLLPVRMRKPSRMPGLHRYLPRRTHA